jgi:hypothetical protein
MMQQTGKIVRILFILTIVLSGQGTVLCFTSGGDVAIERALHSPCHQDHTHPADLPEHETDGAALTDCQPCVDVLIAKDFLSPLKVSDTSLIAIRINWVSADETVPLHLQIDLPDPDTFAYFSPLESIVLLI